MRVLVYFLKDALRGFFQAKLMTFVSIVTVGVALFFLGSAAVGFMNLHRWLGDASGQAGIVVYLRDEAASDTATVARLRSLIASFPQTGSVRFVDKDEARRRFEQMYGLEMLDAVESNPLPAAFEITLDSRHLTAEAPEALRKALREVAGIEEVGYSEQWQGFLQRVRLYFLVAAGVLVPVFILALHFMISNTIKLTIYARRELVTNMHFVGATDTYIKMPFILEGMIQGMVGGGIAVMGLSVLRLFTGRWAVYWGPWYFFLVVFAAGVVFGWMGSRSAVRKFLA